MKRSALNRHDSFYRDRSPSDSHLTISTLDTATSVLPAALDNNLGHTEEELLAMNENETREAFALTSHGKVAGYKLNNTVLSHREAAVLNKRTYERQARSRLSSDVWKKAKRISLVLLLGIGISILVAVPLLLTQSSEDTTIAPSPTTITPTTTTNAAGFPVPGSVLFSTGASKSVCNLAVKDGEICSNRRRVQCFNNLLRDECKDNCECTDSFELLIDDKDLVDQLEVAKKECSKREIRPFGPVGCLKGFKLGCNVSATTLRVSSCSEQNSKLKCECLHPTTSLFCPQDISICLE